MTKYILIFAIILFNISFKLSAQNQDSIIIRKIYDEALTNGKSYEQLRYLCKNIGARLSGSPQSLAAIEYTKQIMEKMNLDSVFVQEVMVPHWVRGDKAQMKILNSKKTKKKELNVVALGNSVGTGPSGLSAEVIEVKSISELEKLDPLKVSGKIVFFNRPMDPTKIRTSEAYGGAVDQRSSGPSAAAKMGAIGVVVRSMTTSMDDFPHTGNTRYKDNVKKIPAVAISTNDAEFLSNLLKEEPAVKIYFRTTCQMLPEKLSYNVIGELRGMEKPDEIILVGGHLDSWDLGEGAHDDGAGCMQSIEVLRLFQQNGIKPKRTIRAVLFMNEENGLNGGKKYAELAKINNEKHIAAIESDEGGLTPRGFSVTASNESMTKINSWLPLFEPYQIYEITTDGGGADISFLAAQGVPLIGFTPDSQRYFDYHHAAIDVFENVNKRELELGGAAMAALVYLISEYSLLPDQQSKE